jgi:hypothetical protein
MFILNEKTSTGGWQQEKSPTGTGARNKAPTIL